MRCGVIAKKIGMTRIFGDDGQSIPVSVLKMDNCQVISKKTNEKHGYTALQVGFGSKKAKNISKSVRGHFAKSNIEPKEKIAEFRVSHDALIEVGEKIGVNHFMATKKRTKGCNRKPSRKEFLISLTHKATHIVATKGKSTQPKTGDHAATHKHMLVRSHVVFTQQPHLISRNWRYRAKI